MIKKNKIRNFIEEKEWSFDAINVINDTKSTYSNSESRDRH